MDDTKTARRTEILAVIKKVTADQLGIEQDQVVEEASFPKGEENSLDADSLDIVELIMAFEEEFGLDIDDKKAEKMVKVSDVIDYIIEQENK